ncbi:hypothetical protein DKX38_002481 [Salix brachista]|uniref:Uncharacterized protein n=1 Tax=Salix brachista TaxID=2182728 RepID=A0A5N5NP21_9ROSI|nr:hypothetical protein DKX38_002481 [Salix brachista]
MPTQETHTGSGDPREAKIKDNDTRVGFDRNPSWAIGFRFAHCDVGSTGPSGGYVLHKSCTKENDILFFHIYSYFHLSFQDPGCSHRQAVDLARSCLGKSSFGRHLCTRNSLRYAPKKPVWKIRGLCQNHFY